MSGSENVNVDQRHLERVNNLLMHDMLITPDNIYIDIALLRDLNIGAALTLFGNYKEQRDIEDHYKLILENVEKYRDRQFEDFCHYIPGLHMTTDDIQNRLKDTEYSDRIFRHAPSTSFVDTFSAQLAVNINHSSVIGKTDPIAVTINTYPLKLSDENQRIIAAAFTYLFDVTTKTVYADPAQQTSEFWLSFDEIYTMYINDVMSSNDNTKQAFSEMKFVGKRIISSNILKSRYINNFDYEKEKLLIHAQANVLLMMGFHYVDSKIVSVRSPNITMSD